MGYRALSEQEAVEYVLALPQIFSPDAGLVSREIGDGNLNLVFHIADKETGKAVIVKQALPYARVVGESWPLTLDRSRIEREALIRQAKLCPDLLPKVYHYDAELALTVMEDLSDHTILRTGLIAGENYPLFAQHIGRFLARTLFYQSDFYLTAAEKKALVQEFINPELCKITEDLVFTDPYYDAETNNFNPDIRPAVEEIWQDHALKVEIAKLKYTFLTSAQALVHGDLHTGSVFVTETSTKVIDPEFAFVGPIGFDVGAILANFLLSYAAQEGRIEDLEQRRAFQEYLLRSVDEIWQVFEREFRELLQTETREISFQDAAFIEQFIRQIKEDALGFAGCKVLRRVIGLAPVADLKTITDPLLRAEAERLALTIGKILVTGRLTLAEQPSIANHLQKTISEQRKQ